VLVVELHAILGSGDVAGVRDALPLVIKELNTQVWISLFRECHKSLKEEVNVCLIAFGFCNGKSEVDGANEMADLWCGV
jgi:hypothetical protein